MHRGFFMLLFFCFVVARIITRGTSTRIRWSPIIAILLFIHTNNITQIVLLPLVFINIINIKQLTARTCTDPTQAHEGPRYFSNHIFLSYIQSPISEYLLIGKTISMLLIPLLLLSILSSVQTDCFVAAQFK